MSLSRFSVVLKALRQLGITQVALYAIYKLGLKTGHYRLLTETHRSLTIKTDPQFTVHGLFTPPNRKRLEQILGEDGQRTLLTQADEIVGGKFRMFGGKPVELKLTFDQPIQHCQLNYGDEIRIGRVQLAFRRHDPLEEELLNRQRLETLGRLGAGVAHDINNVVGAVLGNVEFLRSLLQDRGQLDEQVLECVEDVLASLQKASTLTPRLLRIARHEERRHSRIDLSELCRELVKLMRRTFDRAIEIRERIRPQLFIMGDTVALHQVVMNLCLNARDAMLPRGGTLTLDVSPAPAADDAADGTGDGRRAIVITVADDGSGMDEYTRARVFERFFTTKGKGAGYGIGLSTTRDLVMEHGGRISVASEPGEGSTFTCTFPPGRCVEISQAKAASQ